MAVRRDIEAPRSPTAVDEPPLVEPTVRIGAHPQSVASGDPTPEGVIL